MRFKYEYISINDLGTLFGLGRREMGKILKRLGLRDENGNPSKKAFDQRFLDPRFQMNTTNYPNCWNSEKTVKEILGSGLKILTPPPSHLVEPPRMVTPLTVKAIDTRCHIYNSDEEEIMIVFGEKMANNLIYFLNEFMKFPNATKYFPQNQ